MKMSHRYSNLFMPFKDIFITFDSAIQSTLKAENFGLYKNRTIMIFRLFFVFYLIFSLSGCYFGTSTVWKNEEIDPAMNDQFEKLNDELFSSLKNKDLEHLQTLLSDELLNQGLDKISQTLGNTHIPDESAHYSILDKYYVKHSKAGNNTLINSGSTENSYLLGFQSLTKEMYVSLLIPDNTKNQVLITAVYGKFGDEWKILILQFGQYSIYDRTANDYYNLAVEQYNKSHLIDAVNYINLAKQCLLPANEYLHYHNEAEINKFHDKLLAEVYEKFNFPLTLEQIESKPRVFRIFPFIIDEGVFPGIYYLTYLALDDSLALRHENEAVKFEVERIFTGIEQDKKYVFYRAFNEMPEDNKNVVSYGFVDKRFE